MTTTQSPHRRTKLAQSRPHTTRAEAASVPLTIEELFAGKIKAMIDRQHPRDLYDLFRFGKADLTHNSEF
ncbi:MAG: hypothetical protein DMG30_17735 [Acidobacteria bacterium]|nr:MAG: hypothetical protein DMG30_17735 [Acidobacteriota bacterium]